MLNREQMENIFKKIKDKRKKKLEELAEMEANLKEVNLREQSYLEWNDNQALPGNEERIRTDGLGRMWKLQNMIHKNIKYAKLEL